MNKFILADINQGMVDAYKEEFKDYSNFEFHCGDVFEKSADILISPSNSFGFLNGGIDGAYTKKMGWKLQDDLQAKIKKDFDGELLVGQSTVIETNFEQFPLLLAAPTMRVPMYLQGSPNVYLAARAIFLRIKKYDDCVIHGANGIEYLLPDVGEIGEKRYKPQDVSLTILIPGLGTGTGFVTFTQCASRMRMAYEDFYLGQSLYPKNLNTANIKHFEEITP